MGETVSRDGTLLLTAIDAMPDPYVVIEAVRAADGTITDYRFRLANAAACASLRMRREALLDRPLRDTVPGVAEAGLLEKFASCTDSGQPLILDDFPFPDEGSFRYEIRTTAAGDHLLGVTWWDVTERFESHRRLAASEELFRLVAENLSDVVATIKGGVITWMSPSVEEASGRSPSSLIGTRADTLVAAEDAELGARVIDETNPEHIRLCRMRLYDADGNLMWVEVNAKPFYNAQGDPDGRTASLCPIDDVITV